MFDQSVPVTAIYVGLNALLTLALALMVVRGREKHSVRIGSGGNEDMEKAVRAHGNNVEYVPIALIMIAVLELMSAPAALLHGLGAALTVGRLAHAQGLHSTLGRSPGRIGGMVVTWAVYLVGAGACLWYGIQA